LASRPHPGRTAADERFSSTTFGAHFLRLARISCSTATARAAHLGLRLRDAFVCLGCSVCNLAPMLSPTSTSAMSIEDFKRVCCPSLWQTVLEMRSGFSSLPYRNAQSHCADNSFADAAIIVPQSRRRRIDRDANAL